MSFDVNSVNAYTLGNENIQEQRKELAEEILANANSLEDILGLDPQLTLRGLLKISFLNADTASKVHTLYLAGANAALQAGEQDNAVANTFFANVEQGNTDAYAGTYSVVDEYGNSATEDNPPEVVTFDLNGVETDFYRVANSDGDDFFVPVSSVTPEVGADGEHLEIEIAEGLAPIPAALVEFGGLEETRVDNLVLPESVLSNGFIDMEALGNDTQLLSDLEVDVEKRFDSFSQSATAGIEQFQTLQRQALVTTEGALNAYSGDIKRLAELFGKMFR